MSEPNQADLLRRLLERDPVASSQFCEQFLPLLLTNLGWSAGLTRDEQLIEAAALDALFSFVQRPEQYHPGKLDVLPYLRMSARGDLRNAIQRERRHSDRRAPLEHVELYPPRGNDAQEPGEPPEGVSFELLRRRLQEQIPEARDRKAMSMMLDGVRETAAYARLYDLTHLPLADQQREVKRHKDRLGIKAKRLGMRIHAEQR